MRKKTTAELAKVIKMTETGEAGFHITKCISAEQK
jgi:hypothetical protein